jgi:hypothetical protein
VVAVPPNKQVQRTVERHRGDAARSISLCARVARPMKRTSLRVLLLAAVAIPSMSLPLAVAETAAARQQIIKAIEQEQSRNGPHAERLIVPLTELALLFQESGDHVLAAAATERLLQLVRVNYGLHSLEQAPVIERLIANEVAIGNAENC